MNITKIITAALVLGVIVSPSVQAQEYDSTTEMFDRWNSISESMNYIPEHQPEWCGMNEQRIQLMRDNNWIGAAIRNPDDATMWTEMRVETMRFADRCEDEERRVEIARRNAELAELQSQTPSQSSGVSLQAFGGLAGLTDANSFVGGSSTNNLRNRAENFCSSKNGSLSSFNQYNFNCAERGPMGSVNYGSYNTNILR